MTFQFSEAAVELIVPPCFAGNVKEAMEQSIGPKLVERLDTTTGLSHINIAGREVYVRVWTAPDEKSGETITYVDTIKGA